MPSKSKTQLLKKVVESDNESEEVRLEEDEDKSDDEIDEKSNDEVAYNLDSSDASSSDNDDDDDEDDEGEGDGLCEVNAEESKNLKEVKARNSIKQRYEGSKGKKLYIRFPAKLPEDDEELEQKAKALSALITKVHRPRQKHARFCLVDFENQADRDSALNAIKAASTESDEVLKGIVVAMPRTESDEYIDSLVKQKLKTIESKKAKRRLKRAAIVAKREQFFSSTLIVINLPKRCSTLDLRTAFPSAVDVKMRRNKAAVTLPSTFDARKVYKQPPSIAGTKLKLRFDQMRNKSKSAKTEESPIKTEPAIASEQIDQPKKAKRALNVTASPAAVVTEEVETEVEVIPQKKAKKQNSKKEKKKPESKQKQKKF